MHYIDRLIKFILLFFVFCCFSQISFGQVDTIIVGQLYPVLEEDFSSSNTVFTNVNDKWNIDSGKATFQPTINDGKGELISPPLDFSNRDSIILELEHIFECDPANNDTLMILFSYDGGSSYNDRVLITGDDIDNMKTDISDFVAFQNDVVIKLLADLNKTTTFTPFWEVKSIFIFVGDVKSGNYKLLASNIEEREDGLLRIVDCFPNQENFDINVTFSPIFDEEEVHNIGFKIGETAIMPVETKYTIYSPGDNGEFGNVKVATTNFDNPFVVDAQDIVIFNATLNINDVYNSTLLWIYLEINNEEESESTNLVLAYEYDDVVQVGNCCEEEAITSFSNPLFLLTATTSYISTENNSIFINTNDIIHFEAGDSILLEAGFEVTSDLAQGEFFAYIEDCSDTGSSSKNKEYFQVFDGINKVQVYPNPVENIFNIEYEVHKNSFVEIQVYDMIGNKVKSVKSREFMYTGIYQNSFSTINLGKGMYIVNIILENQETNIKMIKL